QAMRGRGGRSCRDHVGDGLPEGDWPAAVCRIGRAVDGTPRAVADCRQSVLPAGLAVVRAECADPPAHRAGPTRGAVEGVELALVQDVRVDDLALAGIDEPDLVAVSSFDRGPAQKARLAGQRGRRG